MSTAHNNTEAVLLAALAATQAMATREGKTPGAALLFLAGYIDRELPQIANALVSLAQATEGNTTQVDFHHVTGPHSATTAARAAAVDAALDAAERGFRKGAQL